MKRYRVGDQIVEAVQITNDAFFMPHSERVLGVLYYPALRQATVQTDQGSQIAGLGDWIVKGPDGALSCVGSDEFCGTPISADVLVFKSPSTPK
jgi:hypothetical protein